MTARDSRVEYRRRMHRVVDHIDAHLGAELDLATLAEVAHFSPFHFHRLFAAYMGETTGDYLRRRRLEMAANRLISQPHVSVLQIALSVGFGSTEAFAHAFKARFGVSATAWRREQESKHDQARRNADQASARAIGDDDTKSFEEFVMDVKVIERVPTRIVYLRYVGPYGRPLARFWQTHVIPWMNARGLWGRAMIAISHDNPHVTAPEKCRCDVGVAIDDDFVATGDEHITIVPGGRYATAHFFGTPDEISATWQGILRDWLPQSGMQLDGRPMFEHYPADARFDEETGAFECEVTIPVAPL
jgi:AraC family transcriptional regulator